MIERDNSDYIVNGQRISSDDAWELTRYIDIEYGKEDIRQTINAVYDDEVADKISDSLLEEIAEKYRDFQGDGEEWNDYAVYAINEFKKEIDKELSLNTIEIDSFAERADELEQSAKTTETSESEQKQQAMNAINDFCINEYSTEADFSDLTNVDIAYTTVVEIDNKPLADELELQVSVDLENYAINTYVDGDLIHSETYDSIEAMLPALNNLDFNELTSTIDYEEEIQSMLADKQAERAIDINEALADPVGSPEEKAELQHEIDSLRGAEHIEKIIELSDEEIINELFPIPYSKEELDRIADALFDSDYKGDTGSNKVFEEIGKKWRSGELDFKLEETIGDKVVKPYIEMLINNVDIDGVFFNAGEYAVSIETPLNISELRYGKIAEMYIEAFSENFKERTLNDFSEEAQKKYTRFDKNLYPERISAIKESISSEHLDKYDFYEINPHSQMIYRTSYDTDTDRVTYESFSFDLLKEAMRSNDPVNYIYEHCENVASPDEGFEHDADVKAFYEKATNNFDLALGIHEGIERLVEVVDVEKVIKIKDHGTIDLLKNEILIQGEYSYYEGGIDPDGHERKDNYSCNEADLRLSLNSNGFEVETEFFDSGNNDKALKSYDISTEDGRAALENAIDRFMTENKIYRVAAINEKGEEQEVISSDAFEKYKEDELKGIVSELTDLNGNYLLALNSDDIENLQNILTPAKLYDLYKEYSAGQQDMRFQDLINEKISHDETITAGWEEAFIDDVNAAIDRIENIQVREGLKKDLKENPYLPFEAGCNGVKIFAEDFLKEMKVDMNFFVKTEKEQELGGAFAYPAAMYDFHMDPETRERVSDNALNYLINQQGYSVESIAEKVIRNDIEEIDDNDSFINTVANELSNDISCEYCGTLTVFARVDGIKAVDILEKVAKKEGSIEFSEDSIVGLFDYVDGSRNAEFQIKLDKSACFDTEMVAHVQIEGMDIKDMGYCMEEYTVNIENIRRSYISLNNDSVTLHPYKAEPDFRLQSSAEITDGIQRMDVYTVERCSDNTFNYQYKDNYLDKPDSDVKYHNFHSAAQDAHKYLTEGHPIIFTNIISGVKKKITPEEYAPVNNSFPYIKSEFRKDSVKENYADVTDIVKEGIERAERNLEDVCRNAHNIISELKQIINQERNDIVKEDYKYHNR